MTERLADERWRRWLRQVGRVLSTGGLSLLSKADAQAKGGYRSECSRLDTSPWDQPEINESDYRPRRVFHIHCDGDRIECSAQAARGQIAEAIRVLEATTEYDSDSEHVADAEHALTLLRSVSLKPGGAN